MCAYSATHIPFVETCPARRHGVNVYLQHLFGVTEAAIAYGIGLHGGDEKVEHVHVYFTKYLLICFISVDPRGLF